MKHSVWRSPFSPGAQARRRSRQRRSRVRLRRPRHSPTRQSTSKVLHEAEGWEAPKLVGAGGICS